MNCLAGALRWVITLMFAAGLLMLPANNASASKSQIDSSISQASIPDQSRLSSALQGAPVMFVENVGQFPEEAQYQVRGEDRLLWFVKDGLWVTLSEQADHSAPSAMDGDTIHSLGRVGANLHFSFVGANPKPIIEPFNRLDTHVSYFIGNDPAEWRADVPAWGGVRYKDLYPGIDLEITGENGRMVLRLVVTTPTLALPLLEGGGEGGGVRLRVEGAGVMALEGDLLRLITAMGEYTLPLLQVSGAGSAELPPPTVAGNQVTSPFGHPQREAATASPQSGVSDLLYATVLGRSGYYGPSYHIAIDASGAAYVTGVTLYSDFPTTVGAFDTSFNGYDAFVVKLNAAGSALTYATFLGGSFDDKSDGIAIDTSGAAYVTGWTESSDFPTTAGAFDTSLNGDDAFVVKLNAAGSALTYATFLGGSQFDEGWGIAIDTSGAAYVTGETRSSNFPTTAGAFDTSFNGAPAFVVKLNAAGSGLVYATFLGGWGADVGCDIAIDVSGAAYVTSYTASPDFPTTVGAFDTSWNGPDDAFVVKLNAVGSALTYATFLGGSSRDEGYGIAIDASGAAYVTGWTESSDFPNTDGAFDTSFNGGYDDAFVVKLNVAGSALTYATFLGGNDYDQGKGIAIDTSGAAYVTGWTDSSDFPTTAGAFDTSFNDYDAFVVKMNAAGSGLVYATFLGGSSADVGSDIALDASGAAYVTGYTASSDFPTTVGAFDPSFNVPHDPFVVKLAMKGGTTDYSIAGRVTDGSSNPIPDVTISDGVGLTTTTDSSGNYTLSGLASGTYTITPSKGGYVFSPASRSVSVPPSKAGYDFVAILPQPPQTCAVPFFWQREGWPQHGVGWWEHPLRTNGVCRPECSTIGACGCTLTSAAMVFSYYGANLNPPALSDCMGTSACPFYWGTGASCTNGKATFVSKYGFSWSRLDQELNQNHRPVILGMHKKGNPDDTHWVVVVSGQGSDPANYSIHDPWFLGGANMKLSARTRSYDLDYLSVYSGQPSCSGMPSATLRPSVIPQAILPASSSIVTGTALIYSMTEVTMTVQLIAQSSAGNITEMSVWTDEITNPSWQPFSTLIELPVSDHVYARFRDEFGNESGQTSDTIYPINTPPIVTSIFADVPVDYWALSWIERLYAAGITSGCGTNPLIYCPEDTVTRAQMAVFLERGMNGSAYTPPAATGTVFGDVLTSTWAADWIEKLYADGITTGCGISPLVYCPEDSVTRAQMAVFLLRAEYGAAYIPPSATGVFEDVPTTYWAASWIEQLYAEGITTGCGSSPLTYCPEDSVTRSQMAVFLVRTFNLP